MSVEACVMWTDSSSSSYDWTGTCGGVQPLSSRSSQPIAEHPEDESVHCGAWRLLIFDNAPSVNEIAATVRADTSQRKGVSFLGENSLDIVVNGSVR